MKRIAVLGSTGSIGVQTLDVVRHMSGSMEVTALGCRSSIDLLERQVREFHPRLAAVYDEAAASDLRVRIADTETTVVSGMDGLIRMCSEEESDIVVTAIVGMIGIRPTIAAIKAGKDIALANKETCVTAGHIIMPMAKKAGIRILPVDSEHSAIFQALCGRGNSNPARILLTASGGPFRGMTEEQLKTVTVKDALAHPTWKMGPKITVDSATMVNKGLEVIEAVRLFDVSPDQVEVVIQPQSIIHSAVEYEDGSVIAQMAVSDMRIPIQYALTWPDHKVSPSERLDFKKIRSIEIDVPDMKTFRGLPLAYDAIRTGGSMPAVFNAANEWANAAFRADRIGFTDIYDVIERAMDGHRTLPDPSVEEIIALQDEINRHCEEQYG